MLIFEKILVWLGHISMLGAISTLFLQDKITHKYFGLELFLFGIISYTIMLAVSIYLDKSDQTRQANSADTQTLGSVLKPTLLACMCLVLFLSALVIVIALVTNPAGQPH